MLLPEIIHRHSAVAIQDQSIAKDVLDRVLEAGRLSPSIKNRQPWRFIAITDLQKKIDLQKACYGDQRCPKGALIAACYANRDYEMPNGLSANLFDLGLATGQILLQAEHEGLAAEALTSFSQQEAGRVLTLPYSMLIAAVILLGYPENTEKCNMQHKCLPTQRTLNYNSW